MIEVYQAEWCPFSALVRERLTELELEWLARPVAAERDEREEMRERVGSDTIPVVVLDDGTVLDGDAEEIATELGRRFPEPAGAHAHRQAAAAHR